MRDRYLDNCTFAKTMLMIFVIIGHSISFWNGEWFTALTPEKTSVLYKYLSIFIGGFHIYGFALISGYIFYYLKIERNKYQNYLKFIQLKIKRLIIPFLFVMFCWVLPINQIFFKYNISDIVFKFLLGTNPSQLWFLLMLFWVFVIFWPMTNFINQYYFGGIIIVCFLYLLGTVGSNICPNYYMIWTSCRYILFFCCGFFIRKFKMEFLSKNNPLIFFSCYCLSFMIYKFTYNVGNVSDIYKLYSYGIECVFHLTGAITAFFIFQRLAEYIDTNQKQISKLSRYSMPIYLFHEQIIYLVIGLLNRKLNIYILSIVCFMVSISLSYIISKILFKWRVTRILIGEKK